MAEATKLIQPKLEVKTNFEAQTFSIVCLIIFSVLITLATLYAHNRDFGPWLFIAFAVTVGLSGITTIMGIKNKNMTEVSISVIGASACIYVVYSLIFEVHLF